MSDVFNPWEAGFMRRWHANPKMCEYGDTVSSHSHRMTILALEMFEPSRELLKYIALHDLGEVGCGDVAYPFKKEHPECSNLLEMFEEDVLKGMGFRLPQLTKKEQKKLWLVDRLDAFLFMLRHNPSLQWESGWRKGKEDILHMADELGVFITVRDMLDEDNGRS